MPIQNFRLPALTQQRFHEVCAERDISPSDMLRQAVEVFIDRVDDQDAIRPTKPGTSLADMEVRGAVTRASKLTMDDMRPRAAPGSLLKRPKGAK